ncbi:PDZ domain-containing protein [Bradyrhizobium sp. YCK136]|uniref:nSTAND1 domain-containing NTPase n=1 Tax=Bradyrhizobium sp. YCK136 TaxID=3351346 RepID=UPI0037CA56FC
MSDNYINRPIRVFVSSPSDVAAERAAAKRILEEIEAAHDGRVRFAVTRWEDRYYSASKTFQDQIDSPANSDLVVSIFWSRLGLELPQSFNRDDGSPRTGSEYEFEIALDRARNEDVPDILVYRRQGKLPAVDPSELDFQKSQYRGLQGFFNRWFHSEEGRYLAAYRSYDGVAAFARDFRRDINSWLRQRLEPAVWNVETKGSPFRGLDAYEARHQDIFFGRKRAIRQAHARLSVMLSKGASAFLLVLGPSGSGKSSMVRAGLLPRLLCPGELVGIDAVRAVTLRPGAFVGSSAGGLFDGLARLLLDGHQETLAELREGDFGEGHVLANVLAGQPDVATRVLLQAQLRWAQKLGNEQGLPTPPRTAFILFVDQLEEAFTILVPEERDRLFALLSAMARAEGLVILATMRSDYYAAAQAIPALRALKESGASYDLAPPSETEISEIIEEPARLARLAYERDSNGRDLVEELASDANQPGALPLLSFTLDRLFQLRDQEQGLMRLAVYDDLGGLKGAIGRQAERTFRELGRTGALDEQHLRRILRRLVREGGEGQISARPALLNQFAFGTPERRLIDTFVAVRLFVAEEVRPAVPAALGSKPTAIGSVARLRVAHEALFTDWRRATRLIEEDRANYTRLKPLEQDEHNWREHSKRPDLLIPSGFPLDEAMALQSAFGDDLDKPLYEYIAASVEADTQRKAAEATRIARERRFERLTRRFGIAAAIVAILALGAAGIAATQWNAARNAQSAAQVAQRAALASAKNAELAKTEAEAQKAEAEAQRDKALRTRSLFLADLSRQQQAANDHGSAIALALEALPDKNSDLQRPFVPEAEQALYTAVGSLRERREFGPYSHNVALVSFSRDGKRVLIVLTDGSARWYDVATGELVKAFAVDRGERSAGDSIYRAVSPDGRFGISATPDIVVWDLNTGASLATLRGHTDNIRGAAFSADGNVLITSSCDQTFRVWDMQNYRELPQLPGKNSSCGGAVAISPDGSRAVTTYGDTAWLYDRKSGVELAKISARFAGGSFSPDGRFLLISSDDGLRVLDGRTGSKVAELKGHKRWSSISSVAFSSDGSRLATADSGGLAIIWNVQGWKKLAEVKVKEEAIGSMAIGPMAFLPSGLLITTHDRWAHIWNGLTGKAIATLAGHSSSITRVDASPNSPQIATASLDKTVRLWDLAHPSESRVLMRGGHSEFSKDGTKLLTFSGKNVAVWDRRSGTVRSINAPKDDFNSAVFSPDGARILTSEDSAIRLWNVDTAFELFVFPLPDEEVLSAVFSPDGKTILATCGNLARMLDASNGVQRFELKGHEGGINKGLFSPDGRVVLTISDDGTARLWDSPTGKQLLLFRGDEAIRDAEFSKNGNLVATAERKAIRVWHVNDEREAWRLIFEQESPSLTSVHFSPDGMLLAGAFSNIWGDISVWDVATGRKVAGLQADTQAWGVAFSPDGAKIAATSAKGKVTLWSTLWMKLTEFSLEGHHFGGSNVAFSPDGTLLAAGSGSEIRVWPVFALGQPLVDYARSITPRKLTAEQRKQFFLEEPSGIGITFAADDELIRIVQVLARSPAEKAGLETNDKIARVDKVGIRGLKQDEVIGRLSGPVGSKVVLTILRNGHDNPMEVTVTRGELHNQQQSPTGPPN